MKKPSHLVIALDDDPAVLTSLENLLAAHGHPVRTHTNPGDLIRAGRPEVPACLLLDHQLADGMTGADVHADLQRRGWDIPTIFLTAHWSVQSVVNAMRAGADGFLTKPYDPGELLEEIASALDHARTLMQTNSKISDLRTRAATLTPRERSIVLLVTQGLRNREIASQLGLALVTIKVHRGRAMRKLGAGNPAQLAHLAAMAGLVDRP
jgi:FixJ family two-component response regulator